MKIAFATSLILAVAACSQTAMDRGRGAAPSPSPAYTAPKVAVSRSEMAKARVGPTALQIYENPREWSGSYVRLNCEIIKVRRGSKVAISAADARCGRGVTASLANDPSRAATKEYNRELGDQALLALVGDKVSNLGAGQEVRIVGRVIGSRVATVRVDYVE
jgi:hypothetical protein